MSELRPRLCSKSGDKLLLLTRIAEAFIAAGGLEKFSNIKCSLTWDNIPGGGAPDDTEGTVAPIVVLEMTK